MPRRDAEIFFFGTAMLFYPRFESPLWRAGAYKQINRAGQVAYTSDSDFTSSLASAVNGPESVVASSGDVSLLEKS